MVPLRPARTDTFEHTITGAFYNQRTLAQYIKTNPFAGVWVLHVVPVCAKLSLNRPGECPGLC